MGRSLPGAARRRAAGIDSAYPYCELEPPKLFRIYRDVRFSKDKSPYKTHIGGMVSVEGSGGVMDKPVALYLQVGSECFAAAGHYMIPPEKLAKIRRAIVDPTRGKELASITRSLVKRGFTLDGAEKLSRVPRGFDPEHPLAELLKMKGLVAMFPPLPRLDDPALVRWLRKQCIAAADSRDLDDLRGGVTGATPLQRAPYLSSATCSPNTRSIPASSGSPTSTR